MLRFEFHLDLSTEQYLAYYQGSARQVRVRCGNGETLQFPAVLLQRYVTPSGIHGDFILTCRDDFKGAGLARRSGGPADR